LTRFDPANLVLFAALPTQMRASGVPMAAEWVANLIEKRHSQKISRELDGGNLATGEYALHWRPELWRRCAY
jgi:hypothetical protein